MSDAIIIRIGSSLDSSIQRNFQTVAALADKAAAQTARSAAKGAKDGTSSLEREWKARLAGENRVAAAQDKLYARNAANVARAAKQREQASARAATAEEKAAARGVAAAERAANAKARLLDKSVRDAERAAARQQAAEEKAFRPVNLFAKRMGYEAQRSLVPRLPLMSMAQRATSTLATGLGVNTDISSMISKNVERQTSALAISNSGYQEGADGPAGTRVDPKKIEEAAGKVAADLSLDKTDVLAGLNAFVKKTGDLAGGLEALAPMGRIAVAANAKIEDVMLAAGGIATNLKGVPDHAAALDTLMRNLVASGKMGAVELEDFAKEVPKLAAQANRFEGGSVANIKELAGLAQLSMASGGSSSAAQATTSVARLVDTLSTPARAKAFHGLGIETETTNEKGMKVIRDPVSVILDALKKTQGDPGRLKELFASSIGARPTEALASTFRDAGGGEKGLQAVRDIMKKFEEGNLSDKTIKENIQAWQDSEAAKAAKFQQSLEDIVEKIQTKMIPALEEIAPKALKLAEVLGNVATWAVDNPKQAIAAAVGMSIAQAGIGVAIRTGIETIIAAAAAKLGIGSLVVGGGTTAVTAAAGAGGVGAAGAAGAGGAGLAAGGLALGGAGAAAAAAFVAVGYNAAKLHKEVEAGGGYGDTFDLLTKGPAKGTTPEEYDRNNAGLLPPFRMTGMEDPSGPSAPGIVPFSPDTLAKFDQQSDRQKESKDDASSLSPGMQAAMDQQTKEIVNLRSQVLKVEITNFPATPADSTTGRVSN